MSTNTEPDDFEQITELLRDAHSRGVDDVEHLLPRVYDHLRAVARKNLQPERADHTLQATALVHEAWLKVSQGKGGLSWESESQFFRAAARAMRQILVDHARRHGAEKRGGALVRLELHEDVATPESPPPVDLLRLEAALEVFQDHDPRRTEIIELKFFAGLTMLEIAKLTGRTAHAVRHDWRFARAWLQARMHANES